MRTRRFGSATALCGGAYTPGRAAPVFDTVHGRLGIFICHDSRYSELARLMALKGARIASELKINIKISIIDIEERMELI